jgi:radical SAM protein with 4Fe4S-binding SPASM domain
VRVLAFELTKACNLHCPYCRASAGKGEPGEVSTSAVLETLAQITDLGRPLIILTGGEPLLRGDLFSIVERSVKMGFPTALATNGTLVTDRIALQLRDGGVRRVSVSMDFPDEKRHDAVRGKGSFRAASAALSHLREAGVPFQINMTIRNGNAGEIESMLEFAEREGAAAFHLFFVVGVGRAAGGGQGLLPSQYEETLTRTAHMERAASLPIRVTCAPQYSRIRRVLGFEEGSGRRHCMAGNGFLFISARGEVKPCGYFDVVAARIGEKSLAEIWRNAPLFRKLREFGGSGGRCAGCGFVSTCGGCRARALAATGDFLSDDPACVYNSGE